MKRTTAMLSLMAGAAFALMVGMTSCSNNGATAPVATDEVQALYMTTIPNPDMEEMPISDASLDMQMMPMPPQGDNRRLPFGDLLRALKLDSAQIAAVRALLADHEACMKAAMEALRASEKAIIERARAARQEIVDQVKAGTLDRKTAGEQLRALNQATRDALKNNPLRADAITARKACDDAFFSALRGILTENQAAILADWLTKRAAGNPNGGGPGRGNPGGGDTTRGGGNRGGGDTARGGGNPGGGDTTRGGGPGPRRP
ncbi:MAG: hypothetical protein JSS89_08740 [Bacteroidetes bacterium]|nr:hypothetical protein [Bacteroidota bacterium]